MAPSAYARRGSALGILVAVAILAATLVAGWIWAHRAANNPMSEDATITANVVNIAATVPGRVVVLSAAENQRVAKGDLLFALDPEPYRLVVAQAAADLAIGAPDRTALFGAANEFLARLRSLKAELERMVAQCAHGTVADCRVIETLADHGLCRGDHGAGALLLTKADLASQ